MITNQEAVANEGSEDKKKSEGIRVFVYGTLKSGRSNHYLLARGESTTFLGRCAIEGPYTMVDLTYHPGVVFHMDNPNLNTKVWGEVYRIDQETLKSLDILEGNGDYYTRRQVATPWKKAWVYCLPSSFAIQRNVIENGVWNPTKEELDHIGMANAVSV